MKFKSWLPIFAALITAQVIIVGCGTTPQTTAYNTIFTVETTASAAVDGYYTAVIKGIAPTNQVPQVSQAFNTLQAACILASTTSQAGTNALASPELTVELGQLLNLVQTAAPTK